MQNDMRDRLIKLKRQAANYAQEKADERGGLVCIDDEVDYLLANGVILPPCKVGQVVWVISQWYKYTKPEIESRKVLSVQIYKNGNIQYHYKDGCFWKENQSRIAFGGC